MPVLAGLPRWAVVVLLVPSFLDESSSYLPAGALEPIRHDLGLSYTRAGSVLSLLALGSIVGSTASLAVDHVSRRFLASTGALGLAGAMAGFALSPWYAGLLAASFLHGMAATVMMDATSVALADVVEAAQLRSLLARTNVAGVAGDLTGPVVLSAVLALGLNWRVAFGGMAVVLVGYGLVLAAAPLPGPPGGAPDADDRPLPVLRAVLGDPRVWAVGAVALLMAPFDEPFLGFLLARGQRDLALGPGELTIVAVLPVLSGLAAYTVLARRLRAWSDRSVIALGAALAGIGAAGAGLSGGSHAVVGLGLGGAVAGLGMALTWLALEHRSLTLRPGQQGTTGAVIGAIDSIGFTLPLGIGALADRFSLGAALASYALLALAVVLLTLASPGDNSDQHR